MSEVLAHDCAGRPLRVGTQVEVVSGHAAKPEFVGAFGVIEGRASFGDSVLAALAVLAGETPLRVEIDGLTYIGTSLTFKRIDDGDQPADQSFHELLEDLKHQQTDAPAREAEPVGSEA